MRYKFSNAKKLCRSRKLSLSRGKLTPLTYNKWREKRKNFRIKWKRNSDKNSNKKLRPFRNNLSENKKLLKEKDNKSKKRTSNKPEKKLSKTKEDGKRIKEGEERAKRIKEESFRSKEKSKRRKRKE